LTANALDRFGSRAPGRPKIERVFDFLLASSIASWAILGWLGPALELTVPRLAISTLHLTVAVSILTRAPATRLGTPQAILASLPAILLAGFAFRLASPLPDWGFLVQGLFASGAALAIAAFSSLGSSFAVLPALRCIVARGPYRLVRHPAYAGELLMFAACALSRPTPLTTAVFGAAIPLVALRIRAEERLLSEDPTYRHYQERVAHRLVPGLW